MIRKTGSSPSPCRTASCASPTIVINSVKAVSVVRKTFSNSAVTYLVMIFGNTFFA